MIRSESLCGTFLPRTVQGDVPPRYADIAEEAEGSQVAMGSFPAS
jgi:hypothetical protein